MDTSVWVDVERGRLTPAAVEAALGAELVFATPVTLAELGYGVRRAKTREQRATREAALKRVATRDCLVIDAETAEVFGTVASDLDARGRPSTHRVQDLCIASLALQHGHKVLTRNRRDFDDIPGLTVLSI